MNDKYTSEYFVPNYVYKIHYVDNTYNQGKTYGLFYGRFKDVWPMSPGCLEFKIEKVIAVPKDFPKERIILRPRQIMKATPEGYYADSVLDALSEREKLQVLRIQLSL